jgi:hypothetical protein
MQPVTNAPPTGKRGRPKKQFEPAFLKTILSGQQRIPAARLARAIKVHPNTLHKHLKLHRYKQFSDLTDYELDTLTREFRRRHPKSGIQYATGFFTHHGL